MRALLLKVANFRLFGEREITFSGKNYGGAVKRSINLETGMSLKMGLCKIPITQTITANNAAITVGVAAVSVVAVKAATVLTTAAQVITTFAGQPDVPRVLRIVAAKTGATAVGAAGFTAINDRYVIAVGTDIHDQVITEWIPLNDTTAVNSVKAFKTVTSITLPIRVNTDGGDTVSVGYGLTFALCRPVAAATDLIEFARKASAATAYTIATLPTFDVGEATTTIATEIDADDTTIVIASATGWTNGAQRSMAMIEFENGDVEEVIVTGRTTTSLTVVRGANGSTARAAKVGTQISFRPGMTIATSITADDRLLVKFLAAAI